MPRVLLVGGEGIPSGVPRHICHLAAAFQGCTQITVLSDENHGGFDGLSGLDARHVILPGLATRLSLRHVWRGFHGLTRALRQTEADLVWIHSRLPSLLGRTALALRLWRPRCPVAFTIHGLPYGKGHKRYAAMLSLALDRLLFAACPPVNVVYLSQDMADRGCRAVGKRIMNRHDVHVLPNCSDLGPLPAPRRERHATLVMTGRAGQQKNYARAVRLFAQLPDDFRLTLCGPGTDDAGFRRTIAETVPEDVLRRITFTGPVQDVRPYLMAADAYLLTSRYEGLPIGTLEAFEAGLPIILSDFDGAAELVDAHPLGLILNSGDDRTDAERVAALIARARDEADAVREASRAVWRRTWSPEVFRRRSRALLQRMLDR